MVWKNAIVSSVLLTLSVPLFAQVDDAQDTAQPDAQQAAADEAKIAVVQAHVDAYRARNMKRFLDTFSADATVTTNGILVAEGRDAIRAIYRLNFDPSSPSIRIDDSGAIPDGVYLYIAYTFPDGTEICCSYSHYSIEGGKIVHLETSG